MFILQYDLKDNNETLPVGDAAQDRSVSGVFVKEDRAAVEPLRFDASSEPVSADIVQVDKSWVKTFPPLIPLIPKSPYTFRVALFYCTRLYERRETTQNY